MYVLKKIIERLLFVAAYLKRDKRVGGVDASDFLHAMFKSASLMRLTKGRRFNPVPGEVIDGCRKVSIGDKAVFWPEEMDARQLLFTYWEVYRDRWGHMFDTCGTGLREGDVVLDCGACEGLFTLKALEMGAGKVYCFEPSRKMGGCLGVAFGREVSSGKVEVVGKILGEKPGRFLFREDPGSPAVSRVLPQGAREDAYTYPVEMTTVDEFCREKGLSRLDYIKADVEGTEVGLVKGASESIARFGPRIAIAVYHHPDHAAEITSLIRAADPSYTFRLKGLACHNRVVRPMILHCHRD